MFTEEQRLERNIPTEKRITVFSGKVTVSLCSDARYSISFDMHELCNRDLEELLGEPRGLSDKAKPECPLTGIK